MDFWLSSEHSARRSRSRVSDLSSALFFLKAFWFEQAQSNSQNTMAFLQNETAEYANSARIAPKNYWGLHQRAIVSIAACTKELLRLTPKSYWGLRQRVNPPSLNVFSRCPKVIVSDENSFFCHWLLFFACLFWKNRVLMKIIGFIEIAKTNIFSLAGTKNCSTGYLL